MADACRSHGIDSSEVAIAAATKPFGYAPFYPSLGIGGHCIPVNPYYLFSNNDFPLLRYATEVAKERPSRLADKVLENSSIAVEDVRVLVVGVAFKRGQSNISHSPGVAFSRQLLSRKVGKVAYCDPLVAQEHVPDVAQYCDWSKEALERDFDIIVVGLKQEGLDFSVLEGLGGCDVVWHCLK
ncbi:UDP-N-acetyl-D-glucosamine 6-dehydrogenase [Neolecta irregularis DAH-3]|uniref:UDP-N-acetyl-D-glucosamine 6-dehydrogenase n=1 Tax=Neolecta irregularis (strain DAH-3) TaxID=1198029 RepID=A0A1U7LNU4_NEOID|nr:UDP-N-acetyl-D-glucosamine 6-dehydrogenase [Neolecta irregularis DAH-3]|eukprot:OLL24325.1 UDP-N-acetyl-D-glucosamine 6-dehydrogenase [Neolecta irregularis DAH-3]